MCKYIILGVHKVPIALNKEYVFFGLPLKQQSVPDWVRGELGSEISGVSSLGLNPAASSTLRQPDSPYRGNPLSPTSRR